jgi:hypothetical protein
MGGFTINNKWQIEKQVVQERVGLPDGNLKTAGIGEVSDG